MKEQLNFNLDFVGIGVQRAATTWIAECLREHPEVCLASPKEIEFFDRNYEQGLDWYQRHFFKKQSHRVFGEFTSTYIYSPQTAQRIKEHFPDAKLIVCLREPISRLISHLPNKADINQDDFLAKHQDLIEKGLYFKRLQPFLDAFPIENILILIYEDIQQNPQQFIRRIYRFLGVEESFISSSVGKRINPKRTYKAPFLKKLLDKTMDFIEKIKIGPFLKKILIKMGFRRLFYAIDKANSQMAQKRALPEGIKKELVLMFRDDVKKLSALLNRNLWQDIYV